MLALSSVGCTVTLMPVVELLKLTVYDVVPVLKEGDKLPLLSVIASNVEIPLFIRLTLIL